MYVYWNGYQGVIGGLVWCFLNCVFIYISELTVITRTKKNPMPVTCDDLLLKRSPCKHGLWIYEMEKGLFLHVTFKIHFTQVQLRDTMKTPCFFANTTISNIYLIEGSTSVKNLRTSLGVVEQPIQNQREIIRVQNRALKFLTQCIHQISWSWIHLWSVQPP